MIERVLDWLSSHTTSLPRWARLVITGVVGAALAIAYVLGWI